MVMSKSMEKRLEIQKAGKVLQFKPREAPKAEVDIDTVMAALKAEFDESAIESIRQELEGEDVED